MKEYIMTATEEVAMFCRLQMNIKKDLPVRPSEMGVLIYTSKQEEAVTPLMISHFFQIAKPSVTSMVNSLINQDYLIKTPSSTDGRSYTVSITTKGCQLVETTYDEYFSAMALLEEKMGEDDFKLFLQLIMKANSILKEERS